MDKPLWTPSSARIEGTNLARFADFVKDRWGVDHGRDYASLWQWSIDEVEKFWLSVWDLCGVKAETRGERVLVDGDKMPGARFFPDARLNFAENLLRRRDDGVAMRSSGAKTRCAGKVMTFAELYDARSAGLAQAMRVMGLSPPATVSAAYLPNMPEAVDRHAGRDHVDRRHLVVLPRQISAFKASWTASARSSPRCCSPSGRLSLQRQDPRFDRPKLPAIVLSKCRACRANGHRRALHSTQEPDITSPCPTGSPGTISGSRISPPVDIAFAQGALQQPALHHVFQRAPPACRNASSTGSAARLLQHLKEHKLHCDIKPGDRVFYFTTCGWMMWNWLVTGLASGGHAAALRRLAVPSRRQRPVRLGRCRRTKV